MAEYPDLRVDNRALYDSLEVGKLYRFGLTGRHMTAVWRSKVYEVLSKKVHNDYDYSIFCRGLDDKGCPGVIYHWISTSHSIFSERLVSAVEVEGFDAN